MNQAKDLFRAGQRVGGPLARQQGESMVSFCSQRRRWWRTLSELDPTISLSESMRAELMLELSGLSSRQEQLVVKACAAPSKSGAAITHLTFEAIAEVLIEQYASVHLRWSFENTKGTPTKGKGKAKKTPLLSGKQALWQMKNGNPGMMLITRMEMMIKIWNTSTLDFGLKKNPKMKTPKIRMKST